MAQVYPSRRAQVLWFVVMLAVAGLTARLGFWQLDRAHQKQALAALMRERGGAPALDAAALASDVAAAGEQHQRRIVLRGEWMPRYTLYLANRTMNERSGFDVLTPLRLSPTQAVVVQRGWVARDAVDPRKVPDFATPSGEVVVQGRIAPLPSHWVQLGPDDAGRIRQNLDLAALQQESGVALRPLVVVEMADEANRADGLLRQWTPPNYNVERNQGYAVQWFAMSATAVVLYLWLLFFRPRRRDPAAP